MEEIVDVVRALQTQRRDERARRNFGDFVDAIALSQSNVAMRKFRELAALLYQHCVQLADQLDTERDRTRTALAEKAVVQDYAAQQHDAVARLRRAMTQGDHATAQEKEVLTLFQEQFHLREQVEARNAELVLEHKAVADAFDQYRRDIAQRLQLLDHAEQMLADLRAAAQTAEQRELEARFQRDEQAAAALKDHRALLDAEARVSVCEYEIKSLNAALATSKDESALLTGKLGELFDANREVTERYQALQAMHDARGAELEQARQKFQQAAADGQELLRQLQHTEGKVQDLLELKAAHVDKIGLLQKGLQDKEDENEELRLQIADKTEAYEEKIAKKDAQIWSLTLQLAEAPSKYGGAAAVAASASLGANASIAAAPSEAMPNDAPAEPQPVETVPAAPQPPAESHASERDAPGTSAAAVAQAKQEARLLLDAEKRWQLKEQALTSDIKRLKGVVSEREATVVRMQHQVNVLVSQQFEPRLAKLKDIERDIQTRLDDVSLHDEKLENDLLCPSCLDLLRSPRTLDACGHTLCAECLAADAAANFGDLRCCVCSKTSARAFDNQQLERVIAAYKGRRRVTLDVMTFLQRLEALNDQLASGRYKAAAAVAAGSSKPGTASLAPELAAGANL